MFYMQQYFENRLKALAAQKEAGSNPYPHKFEAQLSIPEYVKKYESLSSGDHLEDVEVRIAGNGFQIYGLLFWVSINLLPF